MSAKTSKPDRKRSDRRQREPSEFSEATLSVDRVTRVVKGGRRMRFRAIVIVGNKKGKVGLGTGKAAEVQAAVRKAATAAKRHMIRISIVNGTIAHSVETKFKAARVRLMPAMPGTGIIAGGALRVILDQVGIKDVLSKRFGTRNKLVNAQAAIMALERLRIVPESPKAAAAEAVQNEDAHALAESVQHVSRKETEAKAEAQKRGRSLDSKGRVE
jgi:small subunit ribosomal protein S5